MRGILKYVALMIKISIILKILKIKIKKNMGKIVIDNVPDHVIKVYWENMLYDDMDRAFLPKKRQRITENWFTEEFEKECLLAENDPNNTTYGPFDNVEDFLADLKK